jgi:peptidoglycan/xylan/chitin deacetylase (PgdA/CDA1 family)
VDVAVLGSGPIELCSADDRALAYHRVVTRCKDLPDAERIRVVDSLIEGLGLGDTSAGPFAMLSWDQARSMTRDAGITLHPHSVTHPILSRCGDAKLRYEIAQSCADVERQTGSAAAIFAYPNGRAQDFDERAKAVLVRAASIRATLGAGRVSPFGAGAYNTGSL